MKIKEFMEKVRRAVEQELGEGYRAEIKEVKKNNGVVLHGLMIAADGQNVAPTIYLDNLWEVYEAGLSFTVVISKVISVYRENIPGGRMDMEFFKEFNKVKDRICCRLVGTRGNEELLKDVPHAEFLDLAVCFYYAYEGELLGEGTILIHNSHMEMWETCTEELLKTAMENTPRIFPWECSSLESVLSEAMGDAMGGVSHEPSCSSFFQEFPIKVLSNNKRAYGAACILYPGVLEQIAAEEQKGFYILPSSIHETILLMDTGNENAKELKKIIAEVNRTQVLPEEVLSDSLYYYDFAEKRVRII